MMANTAPRLPPLGDDELSDRQRQLLERGSDDGRPRADVLFRVLVRHPDAYQRWAAFGTILLRHGRLDGRHRELAILRTAWRCHGVYEWAQHVALAHREGVTTDEVERVTVGPDDPAWPAEDAALLRAVDELHDTGVISGATWDQLAVSLDDQGLIELMMVIGMYHLNAWLLNTLEVPLRQGKAGLAER
jgi:alkylhydroperoxidase family enzyme